MSTPRRTVTPDGDPARPKIGRPKTRGAVKDAIVQAAGAIPVNKCKADATIRYDKSEEYPPELWGKPILDDYGQRQYKPCEKNAIKGLDVCVSHGGTLPQVSKTAQQLLAETRDRLMFELLRIALDETYDPRLRFDAMKWGLERAGFQAGVTVSLGMKPWQEAIMELKEAIVGQAD